MDGGEVIPTSRRPESAMGRVRFGAAVAFLAAATLVVGCGDAEKLGNVSGSVSYDGKPVETGSITFTAVDGKAPTAGAEIKDGKYAATKVPAGAAKVSISASRVIGKKKAYNDAGSPEVPITESYIPAKYNAATDLKYEVRTGAQTKDFDLPK
jgi:hypothetical protein